MKDMCSKSLHRLNRKIGHYRVHLRKTFAPGMNTDTKMNCQITRVQKTHMQILLFLK